MTAILTPYNHFPVTIYAIEKPEFLETVRTIAMTYLDKIKKEKEPNLLYPAQTGGFFHEPELYEFNAFILNSAYAILKNQGYNMTDKAMFFQEMWCQEHNQLQGHDEHIHSEGNQISGFYFLDAPEGGSKVALHDPIYTRRQIALPEADLDKITDASKTVLYVPKPGMMYFVNSWLPHSITRNLGLDPTRLVHFNLGVKSMPPKQKAVVL
jgi:uncharacterized protein (TIGR02466 family)